ncbi:hypothetical protein [Shewanella sp. FJAT-52076]|uniref:hypothetical protein n=1 Tax=Shewanella sp. FJAT-52076 TaxID=2864202 RepID=UPI001C655140|nr:hypothetical protein [Shewanella sp. FJAT-52076]QYJ74681.1 hypothetical protein K0H79_15195 [Shewanella sp. FJAT-52076]
MKWWEKTVEYTFVLMAVQQEIFDLFLPLDGDVESIGDAVFGKDSEFYILEFKKSLTDLSSEYSKYDQGKNGYLSAAEIMQKDSASKAHFIVGGKVIEGKRYLSIEARRYYEDNEIPTSDMKQIFNEGITLEKLKEYTKKVTELKKSGEDDGEQGSSSGSFSHQSVLAVSKSKKTASLIPLYYFKAPAPKPEPKNTVRSSISYRPR